MKNIFVTNGIYSTNDQLNFIMQAPSRLHKPLAATLQAKAEQNTEQVALSSAEYLKEYDNQILLFSNTSPGKIIRNLIDGEGVL